MLQLRWWRKRAPCSTAEMDNLRLKVENAELRAQSSAAQAYFLQGRLSSVIEERNGANLVVAILAKREGGVIRIPQSEAQRIGRWALTSYVEPGSGDNLIEVHEELVN